MRILSEIISRDVEFVFQEGDAVRAWGVRQGLLLKEFQFMVINVNPAAASRFGNHFGIIVRDRDIDLSVGSAKIA